MLLREVNGHVTTRFAILDFL